MKALTIWQPWASLILVGAKPYEFRSWPAPKRIVGRRIAIHAGARPVRKGEVIDLIGRLEHADPRDTPCLHPEPALKLLKRVLAGLSNADTPLFQEAEPFRLPLSCIVCTAAVGSPKPGNECAVEFGRAANDSDREETFNWGWPLLHVQPVMPHIEARGAQGFWDWHPPKAVA